MRNIIAIIISMSVSFALLGQGNPSWWMNPILLEQQHPAAQYFIGYAFDDVRQGESLLTATERVKNAAEARLVRSIHSSHRAKIETQLLLDNRFIFSDGTTKDRLEQHERFLQRATTVSQAELANIISPAPFHDESNNRVYAFVAVRRVDLARFYARQVDANLTRAEVSIGMAQEFVDERIRARSRIQEAEQALAVAEDFSNLLVVVSEDDALRQIQRQINLQRTIAQQRRELERRIPIFIGCQDTPGGVEPAYFCHRIVADLMQNNFHQVEETENAYYIIEIYTWIDRVEGTVVTNHHARVRVRIINNRIGGERIPNVVNTPRDRRATASGIDPARRAFESDWLREEVMNGILSVINQ